MVGLPGARISNMSPPTLCLVALTGLQVCLVMLVRPAAQRWLTRERVWTAVVAGNGVIMTIFLWHLTALLIALSALHAFGVAQPAGASLMWWSTRPLVFALAALPLVGFVGVFGRHERPSAADYRARQHAPGVLVGGGIALLALAVFGVASTSIVDLVHGTRVQLAVVTFTSVQILAFALAGWSLLTTAVRRLPVSPSR
jgi:hypothetical protein